MADRIQKVLANAGYGSRRQLEKWIHAGRITINGKVAELGQKIDGTEKIMLDKKILGVSPQQSLKILAYYKPEGEVCTRNDEKGRANVFQGLPKLKNERWINIGRLDINARGLLLFTNYGDLANALMHPSNQVEREYAVRTLGTATNQQLKILQQGVMLEDGEAKFSDIVVGGGKGVNQWYYVVLQEGRNHEVKRLWESQGLAVNRLIRTRFGSYILPTKKYPRQSWELEPKQIEQLTKLVDFKPPH